MSSEQYPQNPSPKVRLEGASGVEGARGGLGARRRIGANLANDLNQEQNAINAGEDTSIQSQIADAVANAINGLRIYGGGDIVVSGKGGSWIISRQTGLDDAQDIPDSVEEVNDVCPLGMWEADPNNLGRQRIQQGFISGGGNNIELTYDNYTPVTGDSFYIEVSWTATVVDDVLVNGGIMTAASIQKTAGSVPGHVLPTKAAPSGTARIPLGTWLSSTQFAGNGCGGRNLAFCAEGGFQAWI